MKPPIVKTRIGISTGQIVRTSYNTGGVIVDIVGPNNSNVHGPVYTIHFQGKYEGWINDVWQDADGMYHCRSNDTLTIEDNPNPPVRMYSLLELLEGAA